ncbi:hypothetical protein M8997_009840 [Phyllobacterium sp. 21LDTY02-6]|jgi:hypothetical protein|uniref:hypothetical protein n=1 Tax=unclassified Phyllobacterium TaxID=2638441 RepID=UPI002021097B|nr:MULTISPECIES: hypothetical protein [unclassified Phyllobacterium]MCO4317484.1 hypothetical protein [Phyllobacterium sp. 21LDTY02-6]MCX8293139.1 hypothetical protein [Phyllobacterium sp. 0TCS1.6A]
MLKLLTPFLTSVAAGEVGTAVNRIKRNALYMAVIAVLGAIGVVFLLVAAYIALSERYGPLYASLSIGIGALVLALILFVIMKVTAAAARKRQKERAKVDTSALLTVAAVAAAPALLKSRGLTLLAVPAIALGALMFLGDKPERRARRKRSAGDGT